MKFAVCVLARNEALTIGRCISELSRHSIFSDKSHECKVFIAANGCNDETVDVAREASKRYLLSREIDCEVLNFIEAGKSKAWNRLVHGELGDEYDFAVFIDSDIEWISHTSIMDGILTISKRDGVDVYTGYPIKNVAANSRKSALDRFSLAASRITRYVGQINGSFYIARVSCIKTIWLPNETPGEDGFLNAMVDTGGFIRPNSPGAIVQSSDPTHYFKAHSVFAFVSHERRMIVGTMINRWIFEHLWSLRLTESAGELVRRWNHEDPHWVGNIIAAKVRGRKWVIPLEILGRRFANVRCGTFFERVVRFCVALTTAILMVPSAVSANRALKQRGAESIW